MACTFRWILVVTAVAALQVPWVRCIAASHEHVHVDLGRHASCACDHDHGHDHDADEHEHQRVSWDVATSKVQASTHVLPLIAFASPTMDAPHEAAAPVVATPHPIVEPDAGRGTVLLL